ncbi:hypothetical protein [Kosakonia sacchari]
MPLVPCSRTPVLFVRIFDNMQFDTMQSWGAAFVLLAAGGVAPTVAELLLHQFSGRGA